LKSKFFITISDIHAARTFEVHQIIKKVLLYTALGLLLVMVFGVGLIYYLDGEVTDFKVKRLKLEREYKDLLKDNGRLNQEINNKAKDLRAISNKIEDIEQLLDLKPADHSSANERIDVAHLSTYKKYFMLNAIPSGYPLEYKGITSKYGWRTHPISKEKEFHRGLDLRAKLNTPIIAPADGVVEYAGTHKKSGYGKLMIIRHSYGFSSMYAHLNKFKAKSGYAVFKGDTIAFSGNSGRSSGPHLHYEIRVVNRNLDPKNFSLWTYKNFTDLFDTETKVKWKSVLKLVERQIPANGSLQTSNFTQENDFKADKLDSFLGLYSD